MNPTESARDRARAKKQAERDMFDEGWLVDTKCLHPRESRCQMPERDGHGRPTEVWRIWCDDCGKTFTRYTYGNSYPRSKGVAVSTHEQTLAALSNAVESCNGIQGALNAQTTDIGTLVGTLSEALGGTEAGSVISGTANQAKEQIGNAGAAVQQLMQTIQATLERFQATGG